jgi:O-antigen ligase
MTTATDSAPAGSRVALSVLLALVVVSPWPFGSVHPRTTQAIALISLLTALAAFLWDGGHGHLYLPPRPILWTLLGLWALAALQLVPLPAALHQWLAPASAFVWRPAEPAAAAVLGSGPHPISIWPDATRRWLAFTTSVVALALAAAPALSRRRSLLRAAVAVVASGLLVTLYGLVARVFLGNKLYGVFDVPTVAPFGPFVSKNHFAGYVELAALLAVGLAVGLADESRRRPGSLAWLDTPKASRVVAAWGAATILILGVLVSLSRGGVLSLTAGLAAFALLSFATRRSGRVAQRTVVAATAFLVLTLGALAVVLPGAVRDRMLTLGGATSEQSGGYRLVVWRSTVRLIAGSPMVGSGFGAYEDALPRFKVGAGQLFVEHAENDYLEALAEGGLAGGLLAGASAALLVPLALPAVRKEQYRLNRALRYAALGGLVAVLGHALFDFNLRIPSNALCSAVLIAIPMAPALQRPSDTASTRPWQTVLLALVLGLTLFVALATSWLATPEPSLERISGSAGEALRRANSEAEIAERLRGRPAYGPDWVRLAWIRQPEFPMEAASLSLWGASLDPRNLGLRRAAERLQP